MLNDDRGGGAQKPAVTDIDDRGLHRQNQAENQTENQPDRQADQEDGKDNGNHATGRAGYNIGPADPGISADRVNNGDDSDQAPAGSVGDNTQETTKETSIRLAVIDDEPLLRVGVISILTQVAGWKVVLESDSAAEALPVVERETPDVILLDLSMPGMDGLTAAPALLRASPHSKLLILSSYRAERDVLEALSVGAHGYLLKSEPTVNLLGAVVAVHRGQRYLSPLLPQGLSTRLRRPPRRHGAPADVLGSLTPREREVFRLAVHNHGNREIANTLHISLKTVDSHRRRINDKLGCHSTAELVHFAAVNGLLRDFRGTPPPPDGDWLGAA